MGGKIKTHYSCIEIIPFLDEQLLQHVGITNDELLSRSLGNSVDLSSKFFH